MPDPWPRILLDKVFVLLRAGYRYDEGPPEALTDTERDDVVTREELERATPEEIAARVAAPAREGFAIGFRR
jgi:hypothetical protein